MTTKNWWWGSAAALALTFTSTAALAQDVPEQVSLSARLTDAGEPVTGDHTLVFRMFDAEIAGSPVWTETHPTVSVDEGIVDLVLGDETPLDTTVLDGSPRWIEITVDGTTLSPRLAVTSVPYAIRAGVASRADSIGGLAVADLARADHTHAGSYLPVGATLSCGAGQVVRGLDASGSVMCVADAGGSSYTAGTGLSLAGGAFSVVYEGTGTRPAAARADHNHAGQYLPLGGGLTCTGGTVMTGIIAASGNAICSTETGDITGVSAGSGLMGGGTTGSPTLTVDYPAASTFSGTSIEVARADHGHAANCPTGYLRHQQGNTVLCSRRVPTAVRWVDAARQCFESYQGGHLCTHQELTNAATGATPESIMTGHWIGGRPGDDQAFVTNGTSVENFDGVETLTTTPAPTHPYYCCVELHQTP